MICPMRLATPKLCSDSCGRVRIAGEAARYRPNQCVNNYEPCYLISHTNTHAARTHTGAHARAYSDDASHHHQGGGSVSVALCRSTNCSATAAMTRLMPVATPRMIMMISTIESLIGVS
jgi:hypothetical protein